MAVPELERTDREHPDLEIEFPPKPEYVRMVRQAVAALARLHGADEEVVEDIKLAVSEACTTAVHGNSELEHGRVVSLWARGGPEGLVIDVHDPAATIQHEVQGRPEELDTGDLPFEQTLALPIIRGLVDEVAVRAGPEGGATIRMVVSLGAGPE
jgi:serine/threonine-protein kinase RsbW